MTTQMPITPEQEHFNFAFRATEAQAEALAGVFSENGVDFNMHSDLIVLASDYQLEWFSGDHAPQLLEAFNKVLLETGRQFPQWEDFGSLRKRRNLLRLATLHVDTKDYGFAIVTELEDVLHGIANLDLHDTLIDSTQQT